MSDRILVLVRHGQSEWNLKNLFTGWRDVGLTETASRKRARPGASSRRKAAFRYRLHLGAGARAAYARSRARGNGAADIPVIKDQALNERDYGDLSGLNKDDARSEMGRGAGACLAPLLRRRRRPAARA